MNRIGYATNNVQGKERENFLEIFKIQAERT